MSPMQAETPSSPQEFPSIFHEVLNEFCPGEQLDSEPLSRNGSLPDHTFEESELGKTPKGDPCRLSSTTAHEFPMRLAVKGEACVLALSVNPVNSDRVGWENSLADDPRKGHSPHSPSPSAETATVAGGRGGSRKQKRPPAVPGASGPRSRATSPIPDKHGLRRNKGERKTCTGSQYIPPCLPGLQ